MLSVALPVVLRLRIPAPLKSHWPAPRLAVTPLPSVNPLLKVMVPLVVNAGFSAFPSVTPSSVPPVNTVPSLLTTVPPVMVPVNDDSASPPTTAPISTVLPVLFRVP